MKATCMAIGSDGHFSPVAEAQALAEWRAGKGPFWIDLEGGSLEDVFVWAERLGVDRKLLDMLQTGGRATKILPFDETVYFEYPILRDAGAGEAEIFTCLCLDRLAITMHEWSVNDSQLIDETMQHVRLREPTVTSLVCSMAIVHSVLERRHFIQLRDLANELADRMDEVPEAVPLSVILSLKHRVLVLDGVISDQLAILDVLQIVDKPVLRVPEVAEFFQVALNNIRATDRGIGRLEISARDLQARHDAAQQEKTNRRLAVLTILSAIFSPLTLLAGIYGMNFQYMPELGYHYAYFVTLGAMALIGGGLFWFFSTRGWLK